MEPLAPRPPAPAAPQEPEPRGLYYIETWGCQMNVHDSEKLAGSLEHQGYRATSDPARADVVLLNTCSIREKAAEKVFSELGRLREIKRERPHVLLGVVGCVAQQEGSRIYERAPYVDLVVGTRATATIPLAIERLRTGGPPGRRVTDVELRDDSVRFPFDRIRRVGVNPAKAFVTVIEGCNHRCTFCIVPTTRGREICRPFAHVMAEVHALAARGVCEVEFLGQTVNAYRDQDGRTLADLLAAAARVPGVRRIRFTTSHPAQMTDRLMDAMAAASPVVCPYLHLPVQSGSTAVLRSMRRGYDRDGYLRRIEGLRRRIPDIAFGTDVIVGYPTETDAEFRRTLELLATVGYDAVYGFTYSPRPGTDALSLGDPIPDTEKLARLAELQAVQKSIQERRNASWVGREVEVLVEGPSKGGPAAWCGRTPHARPVNFDGPSSAGRVQTVRITGSTAYSLRAELVGCAA